MKRCSMILLALLLLSACGDDKNLNQGPAPTSPAPTTPTTPQAAGNWSMAQTGNLLSYCEQAVGGYVTFCGCYAIRVQQLISYQDYTSNQTRFNEVHEQLKTDTALNQCLTGQENNNGQQSNAAYYLQQLRY